MATRRPGGARAALAAAALALATAALGACGFHPLYGEPAVDDATPTARMASIGISPIPDRDGQILRDALARRLTPRGAPSNPTYRLDVTVHEQRENLGILKNDNITRVNVRYTANFALVDTATGQPLLVRSTRSIASYDVPTSGYASVIAERDASTRALVDIADEITVRIGVYLDQASGRTTAAAAP